MGFYDSFSQQDLCAAHRGWRSLRPENTMSAFEAAVGHFDLIELDLQLSRDGGWIVCHDPSLERTTDVESRFPGGFRPRRVRDYTLEELRSLDAGSWFLERDPFGALASGRVTRQEIETLLPQRLPTLDELLAFAERKRMPLNIEIKDMPCLDDDAVAAAFLEALGDAPKHLPILVSSFNHRYLHRLHRLRPSLPLAALIAATHPPGLLGYLKELGVEAYHVEAALADSTPTRELKRHSISCGVYPVNDTQRQRELFQRGFRMIFCREPLEKRE